MFFLLTEEELVVWCAQIQLIALIYWMRKFFSGGQPTAAWESTRAKPKKKERRFSCPLFFFVLLKWVAMLCSTITLVNVGVERGVYVLHARSPLNSDSICGSCLKTDQHSIFVIIRKIKNWYMYVGYHKLMILYSLWSNIFIIRIIIIIIGNKKIKQYLGYGIKNYTIYGQ